jgi:two-component system LytT family sensor kinase
LATTDFGRLLSRPRVRWLLVIGFWTFFGSLFAVELYLLSRAEGGSLTLGPALIRHLAWSYTWALFTPVVLWLRRRFPLDRRRWPNSLLVHLAMCLLMALIGSVVFVLAGQLTGLYPGGLSVLVDHSLLLFATWLHLDPFLYWLIIGLSYAAQYYRESRERQLRASQLEAQLSRARLQALEMQLHPHFLFNALHTIAGLIRTHKSAQAVRVVTGLGELLRRALDSAGAQLVPLKQEIEFVERYLEIEQIRFGDRLTVEMQIEPDTWDARVPHLILQPLVENAIQHGIAPRAAGGRVKVSARHDAERLHLAVWNDGPGLPGGSLQPVRDGLGLATTKQRLEQLYGRDHSFAVANSADGGVCAALQIPFQLATDEWQSGA